MHTAAVFQPCIIEYRILGVCAVSIHKLSASDCFASSASSAERSFYSGSTMCGCRECGQWKVNDAGRPDEG